MQNCKLEEEINRYNSSISIFTEVNAEDIIYELHQNTKFILFTGRVTCPYCRKLLPKLADILTKGEIQKALHHNSFKLLYLESTDTDQNIFLKAFRNKYNIETVPSVIVFIDLVPTVIPTETDIEELEKNIIEQIKTSEVV